MRRPIAVAVIGGAMLALWFAVIVLEHHGNPSTLLAAGESDVRVTGYVAERLGPDFIPQEAWGHDGKFVFVQAMDPFLFDADRAVHLLDAPVYRSQRVLVPAVVGLGAVFGPWGVAWAFPVLMVISVALGAWAVSALAMQAGRAPWWGLAFLANPGLFYSYRRGTVDVLAVALLMLGLYLLAGRRYRSAGVALALAVLAKEVMLLAALGMALYRRREGWAAFPVIAWPAVAGLGWWLYVRARLGQPLWAPGADVMTPPFEGAAAVVRGWPAVGAVVAVAVLLLVASALVLACRRSCPASWAAVGPAVLLLLLPEAVWGGYVDIWRSAAPIIALMGASLVAWQAEPGRPIGPAPA